MSTPDEVAKLREIKRLLDRIQQLPHIAAAAAGNGVRNGFPVGSLHSPAADAGDEAEDGYCAEPSYSPAPAFANGAHNGSHADPSAAPATATAKRRARTASTRSRPSCPPSSPIRSRRRSPRAR